ncbi:MAG: cbb3-type cytochrome c oxidase subunit II [Gammaproteobacteria bacterium]
MKRARTVVLVAGFGFFFLAVFTQGLLPAIQPQSRYTKVSRAVRTDRGDMKWMYSNATDYTPLEANGRAVYLREGCWYCHSQYVRPVTGETLRWGPVSEVGEYAFDQPHLLGTRRIGPDLTRVGGKYSDGWHLAHYWNPRMLTPDSIMPRYKHLFEGEWTADVVTDSQGRKTLQQDEETRKLFDFGNKVTFNLTPNQDGLLFVPDDAKGKYPIIFTPNNEFTGKQVHFVTESDDLRGLVAYVQKLGMNRGKWRDTFEPQLLTIESLSIPEDPEWIDDGKRIYEHRCEGCHGAKGDGNGPAATFLAVRPRNFTLGEFKFRHTPSGSLPTDGDLLQTITRGVRGTAMPSWHMLTEKDRLALIQYIKYDLAVDRSDPKHPVSYFVEDPPEQPIYIGLVPQATDEVIEHGHDIYQKARCWECHGNDGAGDGPKANTLTDDWGFPIEPANFVKGIFKSGPLVTDIYRTITTGLNGTPMPSYHDILGDDDRWALSYYVLTFSAYRAPGTGDPLAISEADRAALDDPDMPAASPADAYKPSEQKFGKAPDVALIRNLGMKTLVPSANSKPAPAAAQEKPN